jgi:isoquinoline 1-oxidoreductase beta subunit
VIHTSFFEQGTGTYTTLRQIVAEEIDCDPAEIQINTLDTDSGVSADTRLGGSRGTRVASGAAFQAARAAKEQLLELAVSHWGCAKEDPMLSGRRIVHKKGKKQRWWSELLGESDSSCRP